MIMKFPSFYQLGVHFRSVTLDQNNKIDNSSRLAEELLPARDFFEMCGLCGL